MDERHDSILNPDKRTALLSDIIFDICNPAVKLGLV
jgi:hypothetical protein